MGRFDDRVVVVTGASRGIGRAVAITFAREGASVVVHYVSNEAAAAGTIADLAPGDHRTEQADLADAVETRGLVDRVVAAYGGIDVLINNAGIYEPHPVLSTSPEEWESSWVAPSRPTCSAQRT